jgi:DNA-binding NarL/FixJ family response regulator
LARAAFDLLVLDIFFSDFTLTGYDVLRVVRRRYPQLPVIMVSALDDWALQTAARREGARGFLSKHQDDKEWLAVVREILAGGAYFREPTRQEQERNPLSARQLELAHLLSAGLSEAECASMLGISVSMVEKHAYEARRRLNARTMIQGIKEFVSRGLHSLPAGRTRLATRYTDNEGGGNRESSSQELSSKDPD